VLKRSTTGYLLFQTRDALLFIGLYDVRTVRLGLSGFGLGHYIMLGCGILG